jgi:hypothetical protein
VGARDIRAFTPVLEGRLRGHDGGESDSITSKHALISNLVIDKQLPRDRGLKVALTHRRRLSTASAVALPCISHDISHFAQPMIRSLFRKAITARSIASRFERPSVATATITSQLSLNAIDNN